MKKLFIALFLLVATILNAQDFEWAKAFGGTSNDKGYATTVDALGNVYTTGIFTDTVDFDPGTGTTNLTSGGNTDIFVQKLDASGNFLWARSFGGGSFDFGLSIAVDTLGNVYTTGSFMETVDFDPGAGTANLTAVGFNDIFIQKLDASGNFLWAKSFGGSKGDVGNSIALDASGNVYTTGSFGGTVDFDPGPGNTNLRSQGDEDVFVQKLDASGNFLWAKSFGGGSDDIGYSIAVDDSGNVNTTGTFSGIVDFDPGPGTSIRTSVVSDNVFVQKLDASGTFLWAKSFGGSSFDIGYSTAVDDSGNVYTTGSFQETVNFDPGAGRTNLTSVGYNDVFVQKLDASGNFLWARSFGGDSFDYGASIAVDASGNVYTTGIFTDTVDFDPGTGTTNLTSGGNTDIFVQKLDASGNFLWAVSFGGDEDDEANSIYVDASGYVYTAGLFGGTVDFDPGAGTANLAGIGFTDVFVHKMSQGITGILEMGNGIQVSAFPNPSIGLVRLSFEQVQNDVEITVTDLQGKIVLTKHLATVSNEQININGTSGIYFLRIETPQGQSVVKLVKE